MKTVLCRDTIILYLKCPLFSIKLTHMPVDKPKWEGKFMKRQEENYTREIDHCHIIALVDIDLQIIVINSSKEQITTWRILTENIYSKINSFVFFLY